MTVTREQLACALQTAKECIEHADDDHLFWQTVVTVLQSALDGMDAPDTAALDALEHLFSLAITGIEDEIDGVLLVKNKIRAALQRPAYPVTKEAARHAIKYIEDIGLECNSDSVFNTIRALLEAAAK